MFGGTNYEMHTKVFDPTDLENGVARLQPGYGERSVEYQIQHLENKFNEAKFPFRMILKGAAKDPEIMEHIKNRNMGMYLNLTLYQRLAAVKDKSQRLMDVEGLHYTY